jgi:hypothetical protein
MGLARLEAILAAPSGTFCLFGAQHGARVRN